MCKILFIDLDGTLLNDDKEITKKTYSTLTKWQSLGNKVIAVTARSQRKFEDVNNNFPFDGYALHNGSIISYKNKTIKTHQIRPKTVNLFIEKMKNEKFKFGVETNNSFFANFDGQSEGKDNKVYINKFKEIPNKPADKLVIIHNSIKEIEHFFPKGMHLCCLENRFVISTNKKANKLNACKYIMKLLKISPKDVYFFGNDENDYSPLKYFSNSIAMKNSSQKLKEISKFVTDYDNNEDGVALFIKNKLGV